MTNENLKEQMGSNRYNRACERLNNSEHQNRVERYLNGKKVLLKKDVAERLDHKEKCEKPKKYFTK